MLFIDWHQVCFDKIKDKLKPNQNNMSSEDVRAGTKATTVLKQPKVGYILAKKVLVI